MEEKLSHEEFVKRAIISLRIPGRKGIHSVFSGFNEAFRKYFPGDDPTEVTNKLAKEGKIFIRPSKKGVVLYLPEDMDEVMSSADLALKKMGLKT